MHNDLQPASPAPVAVDTELPATVKSAPVELDLEMLQHVVGGLSPNGNW